ncbi:hypothetical protein Y032_0168g175 [Ancylostoma ceylanicum]|nr:hypothetical protein Y032_0168g175 [Ancylostoma ceylanicum]
MWEYKTCAEVLQFVMNILSSICSCGIHLYIVIRLVANFDKMSQYKGFIVAQSLVYVIDSVTVSLLNYVWMNDEHDSYGLPFLPISQQTVSALMILMQIVLRIEVELDYMSMLLSTLEGLPVFVCYLTTHQHFKCISSSDRVKRMQSKLSAGLLMLMLILSINNVVSWFYFLIDENYIFTDISDETIATIGRIYHTVGHQYDPDMVSNIDRFRDQMVDLGFLPAKNYAREQPINLF